MLVLRVIFGVQDSFSTNSVPTQYQRNLYKSTTYRTKYQFSTSFSTKKTQYQTQYQIHFSTNFGTEISGLCGPLRKSVVNVKKGL